jgi:hypothetical protein
VLCAVLGIGACAVLAAGLAGTPTVGIVAGLALAGASYGVALIDEGRGPERLIFLAAGALVLAAELAYWSLELRSRARDRADMLIGRLTRILALALGGGALAEAVAAIGGVSTVEVAFPRALALAAAAALLALLAWLALARGAAREDEG